MRRLTAEEIRNTVADVLLEGSTQFDSALPVDDVRHGFDTQFDRLSVPVELTDALQSMAESVAAMAVARPALLAGCDPASKGDEACALDFVDRYGLRLYRRPLTADDREHLMTVYRETRKSADRATSIATVLEAMLQSPHFLFRSELGPADAPAGSRLVTLTSYEAASALSYLLLASAPDAELLASAAANRLTTPSELQAQARRLLDQPRARAALRRFYQQWIELGQPASLAKVDPAATPDVLSAMRDEVGSLWDDVVWKGDGRLATLLSSTKTSVTPKLAAIYGLSSPSATVELGPALRSGFLTQPGFIASHTPGAGTNPVYLGHFVRRKLFCQVLKPPGDVPALPEENNSVTARERFATHSKNPACKGCHALMDPIGFAFEEYGVLGRYSDDPSLTGAGELTATDVDGTFNGPVALAKKLVGSAAVQSCFASQLFEFATGRVLSDEAQRNAGDRAAIEAATSASSVKALILDLVTSDPFLLRDRSGLPEGGV